VNAQPILGIDQGTTGTKAVLLWPDGRHRLVFERRHAQSHPRPAQVEHDPEELLASIAAALAAGQAESPAAIGLANQGETVIAFDAETGRAIHPAIAWMDARAEQLLQTLRVAGAEEVSLKHSGLPLDAYFSAGKLRWILDNVPEARRLATFGRLRLGTSDAFFLHRLTSRFATDLSTASRTGLLNLNTERWDETLCALYGISPETLPEILSSADDFGTTAEGIAVRASLVDQQAALFGHGCREPGALKFTFGTGGFALALTGAEPVRDTTNGVLTTVAWRRPGGTDYALDGGLYHAASAVDWARRIGLFSDYTEIESFDGPSALERGLVFVPALTGLGCPHWDRSAAGTFLGLGIDTIGREMARAVVEGVALRAAEIMRAIGGLLPLADTVSIDGGLSRNGYFCRFLTRALGREVRVFEGEAAALGAALMAAEGLGRAQAAPHADGRRYSPGPPVAEADLVRFAEAIRRAKNWR
jgi:glycerol kinase